VSYVEALERARAVMARDDATVAPYAHTMLLEHGEKRPWSIVLLHGLTNNPGQFASFAPELARLGHNVFVPRMPYHGFADRLTNAIAKLTADDLRRAADEAVDIALGLGERVAVLGISLGGIQTSYLAQYREDVAVCVPLAPDFGVLQFPHVFVHMLAAVLSVLPNFFLWWDPRIREAQKPLTAYPRFATKALLASLKIAQEIYAAAQKVAPKAARISTVVNMHDPAVSNAVTKEVVKGWNAHRPSGIEYTELAGLPENHDIIDPQNPLAATDIVYPKLIKILNL
jgi:esterase/lipase